jgi:hypothetical protein
MDNVSDYLESHFIIHINMCFRMIDKSFVVVSIMMTTMKTLLFVLVYDLAIYMGISKPVS